ncbi:MAG: hypothetical protein WD712_00425 [Candidatus Spechtbacterales bacterium]
MQIITYTTKHWLKTPFVLWVVISTIFMLTGAYVVFTANKANADALTSVKDVLTNPTPGSDSGHTVTFTLTSGVDDIGDNDTVLLEWDTKGTTDQFAFASVTISDFTVSASGNAQTTAADCTGAEFVGLVVDTTLDQLTITVCTEALNTDWNAGSEIIVTANGTNKINNPAKVAAVGTADIYDIKITTTSDTLADDSGSAYVAVIEGVAVSVTVEESLSFSIAGVAAGSCTGDTGTAPVAVTTTATTVPYGTIINTDQFYVGCQLLTVSTNAVGGYSVTAESNTSLDNGANTIDSGNCDGTAGGCTQSAGDTWATDTNNGFGYYCAEGTNTPCDDAGDTTSEYRNFACTGADADCNPRTGAEAPVTVLTEAGTASSSTGTIHYKLNIDPAQTTGITYSNTVTYIATGTF